MGTSHIGADSPCDEWFAIVGENEYTFRRAGAADLAPLGALARRAFRIHRGLFHEPEYYFQKWEARWKDEVAGDAASRLNVLECDATLAGYAEWTVDDESLLVRNVAVDAPFRHGGRAGGAVLLFVAKTALEHGIPLLRLHTMAGMRANIRLYERAGFRTFAVTQADGFEQVEMEMRVAELPFLGLGVPLRQP